MTYLIFGNPFLIYSNNFSLPNGDVEMLVTAPTGTRYATTLFRLRIAIGSFPDLAKTLLGCLSSVREAKLHFRDFSKFTPC